MPILRNNVKNIVFLLSVYTRAPRRSQIEAAPGRIDGRLETFGHPKPVQIAVGIYRNGLVAVAHAEMQCGIIAGVQVAADGAVFGLDDDPFHQMIIVHGVGGFAEFNDQGIAVAADEGDVFFRCAV